MPTKSAAAAEARPKRNAKGTDALALLKTDHAAVAALFKAFEKASDAGDDGKKIEVAAQICKELTIHATIEEEIFYPAVRDALGDVEDDVAMLDEAEVEHASIKDLVAQIKEAIDADELDLKADAKVKVLSEYVEHHVREEEDEMFPEVKKADLDLDKIGHLLEMRKESLKAEL